MYQNWWSYDVWLLGYKGRTDRFFYRFGLFFALLPCTNPENQNFEKKKKKPGDIIILHNCTKRQSYDVWLMKYEGQQTYFFAILSHFLHFYPTNNPKNQNEIWHVRYDTWQINCYLFLSYCLPFYFKTLKNFMAPFYGWGSTASRLEPLRGGSLLFTTKFPEIPGTHFIDLGRMKGWVNLGATQWFCAWDLWIGNPAP